MPYPDQSDPKVIAKWQKEGRGIGRRASYQPWLWPRDFPSRATSSRIYGPKIGRVHSILGPLERRYFYLLNWSHLVDDIREQYPLSLDESLRIAESLQVKHPSRRDKGRPVVMTTDFLITLVSGQEIARAVKSSEELSNSRVIEKLEIERVYWANQNIDWGIVTEIEINATASTNLEWLYDTDSMDVARSIPAAIIDNIAQELLPKVSARDQPLAFLCSTLDRQIGLPQGTSLATVRLLIARRQWIIDILQPIRPETVLQLVSVHSPPTV